MTVIHMPEECFVKIMMYLNGREVMNASIVGSSESGGAFLHAGLNIVFCVLPDNKK